jgi:hypothetical protein
MGARSCSAMPWKRSPPAPTPAGTEQVIVVDADNAGLLDWYTRHGGCYGCVAGKKPCFKPPYC